MKSYIALLLGLSVYPLACNTHASPANDVGQAETNADVPGWVDSAHSADEAMHRFREELPTVLARYENGASSKDALIRQFVTSLANRDTASLARLAVSRGEFAYLYYPNHPQASPPYDLSPQLMWFQLTTSSEKGLRRALREYGGQRLSAKYTCADSADIQNGNRIWTECMIDVGKSNGNRSAQTAPSLRDTNAKIRMFSAIISKDGRYKFLSYANNL